MNITEDDIKVIQGRTFVILPFNKIRKYGGKYVFTQTNTLDANKYEEYTQPFYMPETLLDFYFVSMIAHPNTSLPLEVPEYVCKTMIRNLTVKLESSLRDVSTSLYVHKDSYHKAVSEIVKDIRNSPEIFSIEPAVEASLEDSFDDDTVGNSESSTRAFAIDLDRATSIIKGLRSRSASDLKIYSGGPGTGKTHKCIEDLRARKFSKALVVSLSNVVGLRFLARLHLPGSEQWSFTKTSYASAKKLTDFDAIVVEEASMISSSEFAAVEKLVSSDLPIFFLGDPFQLPGFTGLGNLFATLLQEFPESVDFLIEQHRMDPSLTNLVHRVKHTGILPKSSLSFVQAVSEFVSWIQADEDAIAVTYRCKDCIELNDYAIASGLDIDAEYTCASNGKDVDLSKWEAVLTEARAKNIPLRVISTSNLSESQGSKFVRILSNGEQGLLTYELDGTFIFTSKENPNSKLEFSLREVVHTFRLGYALTIHKAQGSEWTKVFYLEPFQDRFMKYSLNHKYVAITRAKQTLIWYDRNRHPVSNKFLTFNNVISNTRI